MRAPHREVTRRAAFPQRTLPFLPLLLLVSLLSSCRVPFAQPPPLQRTVSTEEAAAALEWARRQLGAPYEFGARGPDRFDSSGIITWSYRQAIPNFLLREGHRLVTDAPHRVIHAWNFQPLLPTQLQPGDLVFLTDGSRPITHGALFVRWVVPYEVMEFLDASAYLGKVMLQEWPLAGEKRGQRVVAVGRLKVLEPRR